jgi:hypothetical protein
VIGLRNNGPPAQNIDLAGFRQSLKEAGYVEGQNVAMVYRGRMVKSTNRRHSPLASSATRSP